MKNERFYNQLVARMELLSIVPPQSVGPLTPLYKKLAPQFKSFPFKVLIPLSFVAIIGAYLILGNSLVNLASLLQAGF